MNETRITVIGRLVADPELRFTPGGDAVCNFTVASNARRFDKNANEWKDEEATFWRCSVWRVMAENVAESLAKGAAVIVTGAVKSRSYETKEGEKRTSLELDVEAVGPDLRWASAKVTKTERTNNGGGQQGGNGGGWGAPAQGNVVSHQGQEDPWATGPSRTPAAAGAGWGTPAEPPF